MSARANRRKGGRAATPWRPALDAHIRHALTCLPCTAAACLPGAERCPAGAVLWAAYVGALPTDSKTETRPSQTEPDNFHSGVSES